MERNEENETTTLEDADSAVGASSPQNMNSSKRKAEDSDVECVLESVHSRKRLCHEVEDISKDSDSQTITVIFQSEDVARWVPTGYNNNVGFKGKFTGSVLL